VKKKETGSQRHRFAYKKNPHALQGQKHLKLIFSISEKGNKKVKQPKFIAFKLEK